MKNWTIALLFALPLTLNASKPVATLDIIAVISQSDEFRDFQQAIIAEHEKDLDSLGNKEAVTPTTKDNQSIHTHDQKQKEIDGRFESAKNALVQKMLTKVQDVVVRYARANHLHLIISNYDRREVLWESDDVNITKAVLAQVNAEYHKR